MVMAAVVVMVMMTVAIIGYDNRGSDGMAVLMTMG